MHECVLLGCFYFCFLIIFCDPNSLSGSTFLPSPPPLSDRAPSGPLLEPVSTRRAPGRGGGLGMAGAPATATRGVYPRGLLPLFPACTPAHAWGVLSHFQPLPQPSAGPSTHKDPLVTPSGVPTSHHPEMEKPYFPMILALTQFTSPCPERRHRPLMEVTATHSHHAPWPSPPPARNKLHQSVLHTQISRQP